MKFRLKKDWYIDNFFDKVKIYDEDQIFTPNEEGNYIIENPINGGKTKMDIEQMRNAKDGSVFMFEEIDEQEINMTIEEIPLEKDLEIKSWRIQLDVKTSLRNLKKIEEFIKENIQELL